VKIKPESVSIWSTYLISHGLFNLICASLPCNAFSDVLLNFAQLHKENWTFAMID